MGDLSVRRIVRWRIVLPPYIHLAMECTQQLLGVGNRTGNIWLETMRKRPSKLPSSVLVGGKESGVPCLYISAKVEGGPVYAGMWKWLEKKNYFKITPFNEMCKESNRMNNWNLIFLLNKVVKKIRLILIFCQLKAAQYELTSPKIALLLKCQPSSRILENQ